MCIYFECLLPFSFLFSISFGEHVCLNSAHEFVVCSQLLPHAADIMRLLTVYFRMCALPELRIKVYSVIKILLMSMGIGMQ